MNNTPPPNSSRPGSVPSYKSPPPGAVPLNQQHHQSPPPGAIRQQQLPPPVGAIPVSSHPMPLLASQLGHPVTFNFSGQRGAAAAAAGGAVAAAAAQLMALSPLTAAVSAGDGKIMARNINGTFAVTSQPGNESELQLYRVLQRANLLSYYDIFIAQGGDDVHQLCEAGEDEFLEIMALVGMASKPLHVRRLQKALQEWVQNPGLFQTPLVPLTSYSAPSAAAAVIRGNSSSNSNTPSSSQQQQQQQHCPPLVLAAITSVNHLRRPSPPAAAAATASTNNSNNSAPHSPSPRPHPKDTPPPPPIIRPPPSTSAGSSSAAAGRCTTPEPRSPTGSFSSPPFSSNTTAAAAAAATDFCALSPQSGNGNGSADYPSLSTSPLQLTPSLVESQIQRIADTAAIMVKTLPPYVEPKVPQNKKKVNKELDYLLSMSDDDPRKIEEVRRFSAIYGRFDCKRKPEKPLTLHEVSVNEAAAQLCVLLPSLLTRRDELFPLARQVVRDSGYQYSKGHSRSQFIGGFPSKLLQGGSNGGSGGEEDPNSRDSSNGSHGARKRMRFSSDNELHMRRREQISEELRHLVDRLDELESAKKQARDSSDVSTEQAINHQIEAMTTKHALLVREQQEHNRYLSQRFSGEARNSTCSDPDRPDTDDDDEEEEEEEEDSQPSYSNTSSPSPSQSGASRHAGSYVLSAASGGQIIAVQNPALSMSKTNSSVVSGADSVATLLNLSKENHHHHHYKRHSPPSSPQKKEELVLHTFKQEPASPPPPQRRISLSPPGSNSRRTAADC